jgi:hypothetical protein
MGCALNYLNNSHYATLNYSNIAHLFTWYCLQRMRGGLRLWL